MRKLLAALAVLATVGCDDPTVHELITSNFVCVYMPWWMGECDSTEMSAKAQSILDYGMVEATAECLVPSGGSGLCGAHDYRVKARILVDGTSFVTCSLVGGSQFSSLNDRSQPVASIANYSFTDLSCALSEGQVVLSAPTEPCSKSVSMETYCTGRNLAAFGVEE